MIGVGDLHSLTPGSGMKFPFHLACIFFLPMICLRFYELDKVAESVVGTQLCFLAQASPERKDKQDLVGYMKYYF